MGETHAGEPCRAAGTAWMLANGHGGEANHPGDLVKCMGDPRGEANAVATTGPRPQDRAYRRLQDRQVTLALERGDLRAVLVPLPPLVCRGSDAVRSSPASVRAMAPRPAKAMCRRLSSLVTSGCPPTAQRRPQAARRLLTNGAYRAAHDRHDVGRQLPGVPPASPGVPPVAGKARRWAAQAGSAPRPAG